MKIQRSLSITLLFLLFLAGGASAFSKQPKIVLKVLDSDTRLAVTPTYEKITELSTNVHKNESFIYKIEIQARDFNPYVSTIDIPWSMRGKTVIITNLMVSQYSFKKPAEEPSESSTGMTVSGIIKDSAGNPLPNVLVRCFDETSQPVAEQFTGEDGKYLFAGLPVKKYVIRASSAKDVTGKEILIPKRLKEPLPAIQESAGITTKADDGLPPFPDDAVTIRSAMNGMLVLAMKKTNSLEGVNIAVKSGGKVFFVTPANDLSENPTNHAFTSQEIILTGKNIRFPDGSPLFRDGVAFDLYIYPFYGDTVYSPRPRVMKNIMTRDTVPPPLPVLESVSFSNKILTVRWRPAIANREPLAYRIYYRTTNVWHVLQNMDEFTTDAPLVKSIPFPPAVKDVTNIFVTVTAVDVSLNESDFRESETVIESPKDSIVNADIVLEKGDLPAVEFPKRPVVVKPKPKPRPRVFTVNSFIAGHFAIPAGTTLRIKDRTFRMPKGSRVVLGNKAALLLENVRFISGSDSTWFGISCKSGSLLNAKNCVVSGAETGIEARDHSKVVLQNTRITRCGTGLSMHSSSLSAVSVSLAQNSRSADFSYSTVTLKHSSILSNGRNINAAYSTLDFLGMKVGYNRSSFVVLKGTIKLAGSEFFANGGDGLLLDAAQGTVLTSSFRNNLRNGILCSAGANPVVEQCDFIGNGYHAVKNGGRIRNSHIARNNRSDRIDSTPDNGSDDDKFFTFSNMSIQQIFAADSVRGLKSVPHFNQEVRQ